jgi:nicotinate phosphoribosyltransferase
MEKNDDLLTNLYMSDEYVNPLLTDFYQLTMMYSHWKYGREKEESVFDMYYRKNPFESKFCIFGGLNEIVHYINTFKFREEHINYLKKVMTDVKENEFFDYLQNMKMNDIEIKCVKNGELVFGNEPLVTIKGPINKIQIIETAFLNFSNYPTLITSLVANLRLNLFRNGNEKCVLVENGSAFAQSFNGAMMGLRYSKLSGVDYTTNIIGKRLFNFDLFNNIRMDFEEIRHDNQYNNTKKINDSELEELRQSLDLSSITDLKKLNEFIKDDSICLNLKYDLLKCLEKISIIVPDNIILYYNNKDNEIDLFNTFIFLLNEEFKKKIILNYSNKNDYVSNYSKYKSIKQGIEYDGNMIKNPNELNDVFKTVDYIFLNPDFIVSKIQPALGMVYKIVEINNEPCIKFSDEIAKQTIPGNKLILRMFDKENNLLGDLLCLEKESEEITALKDIKCYDYRELDNELLIILDKIERITKNINLENQNTLFNENKVFFKVNTLPNNLIKSDEENKKEIKVFITEKIRNILKEEINKLKEYD